MAKPSRKKRRAAKAKARAERDRMAMDAALIAPSIRADGIGGSIRETCIAHFAAPGYRLDLVSPELATALHVARTMWETMISWVEDGSPRIHDVVAFESVPRNEETAASNLFTRTWAWIALLARDTSNAGHSVMLIIATERRPAGEDGDEWVRRLLAFSQNVRDIQIPIRAYGVPRNQQVTIDAPVDEGYKISRLHIAPTESPDPWTIHEMSTLMLEGTGTTVQVNDVRTSDIRQRIVRLRVEYTGQNQHGDFGGSLLGTKYLPPDIAISTHPSIASAIATAPDYLREVLVKQLGVVAA